MEFEENLRRLCDEFGKRYPLREDDVLVNKFTFMGLGKGLVIEATDTNRPIRFFIGCRCVMWDHNNCKPLAWSRGISYSGDFVRKTEDFFEGGIRKDEPFWERFRRDRCMIIGWKKNTPP